MPDRVVHDFPLFPLGLAALPGEIVPLHIFEERYKTMIGECLERESEFGLVAAGPDGTNAIGCAMEVTRVLEELPDGRMNILTSGTRVFRVIEEQHDLPYGAATVEFLEDSVEEPSEQDAQTAREAYRTLVDEASEHELEPEVLATMSAYDMAATVEFGLEAKQSLLTLRSENARMRLVARLFRAATKRLEFIERAEVRARSNGRVRFG